mgnify:CR=1 FL=1
MLGMVVAALDISTHALREEGDGGPLLALLVKAGISTHALREEGDARRMD